MGITHHSARPNRRAALIGIVAGSMLTASPPVAGRDAKTLAVAREQAAGRRRRVIYNNDGDDIWAPGANTPEKFLEVRHKPLLGTHVDSIFYCTTQSFNHFTHQTKVAEVFEAKSGQFANNNLTRFLQQNTDGLRMSSAFARQHGLESFWTLRMNDIHDAWTPALLSQWKRDDPQRTMATLAEAKDFVDRRRLWSLVDFEHPDVQPRILAIIGEVLRNYDLDGIELDFLRAPFYFRTAYEGRMATSKQIGILSRLTESIRALVNRESLRKGKPILLSARVPTTPALCRKIGIDIEAWLQQKLLDLMTLGGGYLSIDVKIAALIELGHQHSVPVYPCLSQSGLTYRPPRGKSTKQPVEAWYGAASRLWADQADGIYTFNLFPGPGSEQDRKYARTILSTIGSSKTLHQSPIMYAMSDAGHWMPSHYWAKDAAEFSESLPMDIEPDEYTRTYMTVPEDFSGAGFDVAAELRVDFTGLNDDSKPVILFGSANFGPQQRGEQIAGVRRFTCRVPVPAITQGRNRVMVKVKQPGAKLAGVELWIHR